MAVTSDTATMFNNTSAGTSHTFSFTIPAGTNRLLVVRAAARRGSTGTTTITATWGGVAMTEAVTINRSDGSANHHRASVFYYVAGTGAESTNDIVINGNVSLWYAGSAQTLYDVHAVTQLGNTATDSGSDAAATATLSTLTDGSFSVGIGASGTTGTATYSWANVTEDANYDAFTPATGSNLSIGGAYYANASAGSVAFAMTRGSAASHVLCAAEFLPAAVTGSLVIPRPTRAYIRF